MKTAKPVSTTKPRRLSAPLLLLIVLAILFWRSFLPGFVHFSNDGPLGMQNAAWMHLPEAITGSWYDLNSIGTSAGAVSPSITSAIRWVLGPVGYAKFLAPVALWILGTGAWFFFRQLKLSPLAAALGGLAAALNSDFFATACWGVASQQIAIGMDFFALGLVAGNSLETPALTRWTRLALAGLCVGMNVMEAADIGAIFSVFIAAFAFFKAVNEEGVPAVKKICGGIGRVAVVTLFAGFLAMQTVLALVGSTITGIAGTGQDAEAKAARWDWATQWSLPKTETLGLFVPGLFGYKLDTPKDMMPALQDAYKGGEYWGGIGREPAAGRANSRPALCGKPAAAITWEFSLCCWRPLPSRSHCGGKIPLSAKRKNDSSGSGSLCWPVRCCCRGAGSPPFFTVSFMHCRMPPPSGIQPNSSLRFRGWS
jgi:hypothetical protein